MTARRSRGQATTELALGSLVFVVVLLFGIHFGEVPVMMLKVKEAANYSVTHATGERTHLFTQAAVVSGATYAPYSPAAISTDAQARYRDFDGMSDRVGATTFSAALTQASGFTAQCAADNAVSFAINRPAATIRTTGTGQAFYDDAFTFLTGRYQDRGGTSCAVSAQVTAFRIPSSFVDTGPGAMSKAPLVTRGTFPICGAGRPTGGACKGKLTVLTGDWAFDGPLNGTNADLNDDVETVQDSVVSNDAYAEFVRQLYTRNGDSQGTAGRKLIKIAAGVLPGMPEDLDESAFNMSFKGVQNGGALPKVARFIVTPARLRYQTSGADLRSNYVGWNEVSETIPKFPTCFLGLAMPPKVDGCR